MVPAAQDIEDSIRDAKLGTALRRHGSQSGVGGVGGATGLQPSVLLQAIIGLDTAGCARERLHSELLNIPARDH